MKWAAGYGGPSLISDMQGKTSAVLLEASTIPAGTTILDAVIGMGNNIRRLFVIQDNFPSDIPAQTELAIDVIKQKGTGRILVIAWAYNGGAIYTRQIFNDVWLNNWQTFSPIQS